MFKKIFKQNCGYQQKRRALTFIGVMCALKLLYSRIEERSKPFRSVQISFFEINCNNYSCDKLCSLIYFWWNSSEFRQVWYQCLLWSNTCWFSLGFCCNLRIIYCSKSYEKKIHNYSSYNYRCSYLSNGDLDSYLPSYNQLSWLSHNNINVLDCNHQIFDKFSLGCFLCFCYWALSYIDFFTKLWMGECGWVCWGNYFSIHSTCNRKHDDVCYGYSLRSYRLFSKDAWINKGKSNSK